MGTAIIPARYRGLIRPDDRLSFWASESGVFAAGGTFDYDLGEMSPVAGIPSPVTETELGLRATGEQSEDVEVLCNRSGLPVLDGLGYLVRDDGGATDDWMGCDLPMVLGAFSLVVGPTRGRPHVVRADLGTALVVYTDAAGAIYSKSVTDGGAWSAEITIDGAAVTDPYPCLLPLPTGRVLCFRWADDGADNQVRAWYTTDTGATWTAIGPVLKEAVSGAVYPTRRRLRAVYHEGIITLFGHLRAVDTGAGIWRDRVAQWASSDGGTTFTEVTISDGSDEEHAGGYIDAVVWRGEIVLARLIGDGAGAVEARVRRLSSGWYPWTSGDEAGVTGALTSGTLLGVIAGGGPGVDTYLTEGELTLWAGDDSALYISSRHCSGAHDGACPVLRSTDGGDTWLTPGSSLLYAGRGIAWNYSGSADEEARDLAACEMLGHTLMVHTGAQGGVLDDTIYASWLGGWQDVPMPSVSQVISPTRRIGWHHSGEAFHLPDDSGIWTSAPVGAPVITLGSGILSVTTGPGVTQAYSIIPSGTLPEGVIAEFGLELDSTAPASQATIRIRLQDATPQDFDCQVEVTLTSIRLWDNNAGAIVGSALTYTGGPVAIRISMEGDAVRVFALTIVGSALLASPYELAMAARDWTEVAKTATLTAGGGAASNLILWRTEQSSHVWWYWWCFASDAYCGDHLYTQPTRQKFPRSLIESPSDAIRSVRLSSVSGPAAVGDQWDVEATAHYPYEAILPQVSPSPRHPWRSEAWFAAWLVGAAGPTGRLSWRIRATAESTMGALWGVFLDGLNMGGVQVYLYYGGAWNLAGSVGYYDFTANFYGRSVQVSAGTSANSAVLRRDELAGCLFEVVNAGATVSLEQHKVVSNDPGAIDTASGTSLPLRLLLDDAPVTASPARVRIYPRRCLLLLDLSLYATQIIAIQIRWPIPRRAFGLPSPVPGASPDGYDTIATMAAGPLWAWGTTHSWGRRLSTEADTELVTAEDGTRMAYERAPVRRRWSLTWSDPVAEEDFLTDTDPDYIAHGTSKPALAFRYSTPIDVADQLRALSGSLVPVVHVPSIDSGGTGKADHWGDGAALVRIVSAVDRDQVQGDEERTISERVQELVLEEEL